jgi:hypothetical protein
MELTPPVSSTEPRKATSVDIVIASYAATATAVSLL